MSSYKKLYVTNRDKWRAWLKINHTKEKEVWLVYYKKHTAQPRIPYDHAVEEALCFGWIDSTVKRIDDKKYMQKFTPRRTGSSWSELNKNRVQKLLEQGQMTEAGLSKVRAARKSGEWDIIPEGKKEFEIPQEFSAALTADKEAKIFFDNLSPSCQKQYVGWISSAKKRETRERRAKEALKLLGEKQKLGMK